MIIAVSDTHLGYDQADSPKFLEFINSELMNLSKNDHLVLLGDMLDYWRGSNIDTILSPDINNNEKINEQILSKIMELNQKTNVYYIIGNHDYTVIDFLNNYNKNFQDNDYPLKISKFLRLVDEKLKIFFMHGYQLEVISSLEPLTIEDYEKICTYLCDRTSSLIGKRLSELWELLHNGLSLSPNSLSKIESITKPPEERKENLEKIKNIVESVACRQLFFGIRDDEFLVFGHTHKPFINQDKRVANTGSWLKYRERKYTFIKIKDGEIELLDYH